MAETLVISGIKIDTAELLSGQRRIEQAITQIERRVTGVDRAVAASGRSFDDMGRRIARLAAGYITLRGALNLGSAFFRVNAELQDLHANLTTVTGSAGKANAAFRDITDFARTTPFEIKSLTEAFVRFQAFGAGPTIEQFRGLGNISAAFSRDITTLSDAVVSAVNTSIEPIRQFGVQAAISGDKMQVSFNGVTATIPRTTAALTEFLAEAGNTGQFAGAMERRMETLGGATSNLRDVITLLAKDIGEQGLNAQIIAVVKEITAAIQSSDDFARSIGQGAAGGVRLLHESIRLALPAVNALSALLARVGDQAGRVAAPGIDQIRRLESTTTVNAAAANAFRTQQALRARLRAVEGRFPRGFDPDRVADIANIVVPPGIGRLDPWKRLVEERQRLIDQINAQDLIIQEGVRKKRELIDSAMAPPVAIGALLGLGDTGGKKVREQIDPIADALEKLGEELRGVAALRDALKGTGIEFDANAEAAKAYQSALEAVARVEGVSADLVAELAGNYVGLERSVRRAAAAEEQRDAMAAVRSANAERHEEFLRGVARRQNEMSDELVRAEIQRQRDLAEQITGSFSDAFASVITGTQSVAEAFEQMAQQILAALVRIQIQRAIIEPLMKVLFPPTDFSGGIDLGGPGGGLPGFAAGGFLSAGRPAIVGERGPELFVPSASGSIVPGNRLGGGPPKVENHFHSTYEIRAIDTRDMIQAVRQIAPAIASETAREVERSSAMRRRMNR